MMDIKEVLLQWFINFIDKKSSATRVDKVAGGATKNKNMPNQQLAEELHKPIIRKYKNAKYTHLLKTIFGMLILQICS